MHEPFSRDFSLKSLDFGEFFFCLMGIVFDPPSITLQVTRRSAKTVFKKLQRSTLATDMLEEIHDSFNALFPVE